MRLVRDDLVADEVLLGGERAAFDDGIGDLCGEQTDRAERVVVTGNHVVDFVRIAVRIDDGNDRNAAGAALP